MKASEELNQRLARLQKWSDRYDRLLEREARHVEAVFVTAVAEWETERKEKLEAFAEEEMRLQSQMDQAGKEFSQAKYKLERDTNSTKIDFKQAEDSYRDIEKKYAMELNKVEEEKVNFRISIDRQKSALTDLYQEKMRNLTVTRAGLLRQWQAMEVKVNEAKDKANKELNAQSQENSAKIARLQETSSSKRDGWNLAIETIKKELDSLSSEKDHLQRRLTEIRGEKEKELEAARLGMAIAREQLEVDKATLIEKAEEDQRRCEAEVAELKTKIDVAERDLQDFTSRHEKAKKDSEEAFLKEENMLKEAVKSESDKRDYEQKLFEQEKTSKEKELNRLREEYEKKKWHWDNQIRSLMMQKAVHDSEHDADRLRVDREARTVLRGLEAKRDELKQRLSELKSRHESLAANADKENQLINQRWHWRRDRLWALWQGRLETLRKERAALQEQIEAIQTRFLKEHSHLTEDENRETKRTGDLETFVVETGERNKGHKKQKEIQIELEKTRFLAQIKECETLIGDWTDRLKHVSDDLAKNNSALAHQVNYMERWYRDEEKETELFLHSLQNAMSLVQACLDRIGFRKAA